MVCLLDGRGKRLLDLCDETKEGGGVLLESTKLFPGRRFRVSVLLGSVHVGSSRPHKGSGGYVTASDTLCDLNNPHIFYSRNQPELPFMEGLLWRGGGGADINGAMPVLDEAGAARRVRDAQKTIGVWESHPDPLVSCQWAVQLTGDPTLNASLKRWAHDGGEIGGHPGAFSAAQELIREAGSHGFWGDPGIAGSIWRDVELVGSDGSAARPVRLALYAITEKAPLAGPGEGPVGNLLVGFRVVLLTDF